MFDHLLDPHGCEPNEYRCSNKRCVLKTWVCDGEDDCGDRSDEINCGTSPPGSTCQYHEYACQSGNQCIPKSYHCDGQSDCQDNSDEIGCCKFPLVINHLNYVPDEMSSFFHHGTF